nr:MAG TPA: hypothetical protein [Caudoviricetes sp.]DAJ10732.1 MAG TPA: hypothetical protein [Caudoviricetes sp.]
MRINTTKGSNPLSVFLAFKQAPKITLKHES